MEQMLRKERIDRGIRVRTEGIYAISHWQELTYLILPRLLLIGGFLLAPVCLLPFPYWQRIVSIICVYGLLAISFDFLANFVGLVCLGGAFFVGIGGYVAALLNTQLGLPSLLSIPAATIGGAVICTLLFLPCLPLRGIYFAIVTLMYPLIFSRIIEAFNLFGGTDGIAGVVSFPNVWLEQYVIISLTLFGLFGLRRLVNEDIGLVLRGIKDNDQAVKASGIDITRYKALAVFIASLLGCFAGAYLAHLYMWAGISLFALDFSIMPIAATVIGGGGSLAGALVGSLIIVPISELLRAFGTLRIAIYALILTAFIVFRSEGIMVYAQRKYHQFERWVKV